MINWHDLKFNEHINLVDITRSLPYHISVMLRGKHLPTIIFLNGMVIKADVKLPYFHRYSWADHAAFTKYNCIFFADPCMALEKVEVGWYFHDILFEDRYFCRIVDHMMAFLEIGPRGLVFTGSSAGGYAAAMYSLSFPGSTALIENAQTDPFRYYQDGPFQIFKEKVLKGMVFQRSEVDILAIIRQTGLRSNIIYSQVKQDIFHYDTFFRDFQLASREISRIQTIERDCPSGVKFPHNHVLRADEHAAVLAQYCKLFCKVSVIVPVRNNRTGIERCLDSLFEMSFPSGDMEVIVVDNGSTDGTVEYVRSRRDVMLLEEKDRRSSYAARNRGIMAAHGDILAFTDSDCKVDPLWLQKAVVAIEQQKMDIVVGRIARTLPTNPTTADLVDDHLYLRNDRSFIDGVGATANMIVRRECFEKAGLFPAEVKAGGDWIWSARATRSGLRLGYAAEAVVVHPTHGFVDLVKKVFRGGTCYVQVSQAIDPSGLRFWWSIRDMLFPKTFSYIKYKLNHPRGKWIKSYLFKAWIIFHALHWMKLLGVLAGLFGVNRSESIKNKSAFVLEKPANFRM